MSRLNLHRHAKSIPPLNSGFTLVEVLVALLIMSVIAMMAWRGLDGIMRSRDIAQASTERVLKLQSVIAQWEADLNAIIETGNVPAFEFNGSALRLTRRSGQGVQWVVWRLQDQRWVRWNSPVTTSTSQLYDDWLRSQQLLGNEPGHMTALEGVSEWHLYYFRNNAWSNALSSGNDAVQNIEPPAGAASPPSTPAPALPPNIISTGPLPLGVRLELIFAQGSGWNNAVLRDVKLSVQSAQ